MPVSYTHLDVYKRQAQECLLKEEQYGSQRAQWQEEKEKRSASHKTFFEKRDHLSEKTSLLDKECFRLRSQTEKIEEQREGQISYMWEEYAITPNNALQYLSLIHIFCYISAYLFLRYDL